MAYAMSDGEEAPQGRRILPLLVPLMLVLFISTLDQTIVATALGGIGRSLGGVAESPWVATAYLLTSAVTTLVFGKLGDLYGRKGVFILSVVLFVVGSALCAAAPTMLLLILFRGFQGIGGGGLNSLVQAIVGDLVPARERGKYQASISIVPLLGLILGPILGGAFVDLLSWRWIFLVNVPIGAVAAVVIALRLRLPVRRVAGRVDVLGAILAVVFTTSLLLVTVWGGSRFAWGSPEILLLGACALVGLALYLLVERRAEHPLTPLRLFRSATFSIASAQFLLSTGVLFVAMLFVPLFLQDVRGLSAFAAGLFEIPLLVGLVASSMLSGSLIARNGRYKIYPTVGAVVTGIGMAMLALTTLTTPLWEILGALALAGIGIGFFVQVAVLAGQNAAEPADLGVATGALNFFKTLGGAAASAGFAALLAARLPVHVVAPVAMAGAYQLVFWATLPVLALTLVLALLMPEKPLSETVREIAEGTIEAPEY